MSRDRHDRRDFVASVQHNPPPKPSASGNRTRGPQHTQHRWRVWEGWGAALNPLTIPMQHRIHNIQSPNTPIPAYADAADASFVARTLFGMEARYFWITSSCCGIE